MTTLFNFHSNHSPSPGGEGELKLTNHMTLSAHLFDISRATDALTLQIYREDVLSDDCLSDGEKEELCCSIEKRFAFLNARGDVQQNPR
jgi:hypothetical protein